MRLSISHETTYAYDEPVAHGLQRLRLHPQNSQTLQVSKWATEIEGGYKQVSYTDHYGNFTELVSIEPGVSSVRIVASGVVDTTDAGGIVSGVDGFVPRWLFLRSTDLTTPGDGIWQLIDGLDAAAAGAVPVLHQLSERVAQAVAYKPGETTATDTAEQAIAAGFGVCQDHAHVFAAGARSLGLPARYVSGYLHMEDATDQDASHAWAEVWVEGLGWVGFDPSNGISPDDRYVRLASGLDYHDASPISGIRFGIGTEQLEVSLQIQQ